MTERQTLYWIKANLASYISQAIQPGMIYSEDWLAGMVMRETGILIMRYADKVLVKDIHVLMRGDYSQRHGETEKQYHGYGYMQIDIDSYPDFVRSGKWKYPLATFIKSIEVLEEKRLYIQSKITLDAEDLCRAITAAYNCGQGNVIKALASGKDVDAYTYNHDYSKEVWRFRKLYATL